MPKTEGKKLDESSEPATSPNPSEPNKLLAENKHKSTSGLSWDETSPKPGDNFNRVTEMGEAD